MSRMEFHFGLIGWPLGHSLSPALHQAALAECGLAGDYRLFTVPPLPAGKTALIEVLHQLKDGALNGLNVTIPWKEDIRPFCDTSTRLAESVGAANTLIQRSGRVLAENTDVPGFLADLQRCFPTLFSKSSSRSVPVGLVLGTGGAARAAAFALAKEGWKVVVAGRSPEKAGRIVGEYHGLDGSLQLEAASLSPAGLSKWIGENEVSLIVNATPAGMAPNLDCSPWPPGAPFPPQAALYDLVYNPAETLLVSEARRAGLSAETGAGMLLEQAALSFECWTGLSAPRQAMWKVLEKELANL